MARLIEFSRRSTNQLQKILTFYDERNGSDAYSRHLLKCLLEEVNLIATTPTIGNPSTRLDVRFFYMMGFTVIYRFNSKRVTILSIRSSARRPLKIYQKQ